MVFSNNPEACRATVHGVELSVMGKSFEHGLLLTKRGGELTNFF